MFDLTREIKLNSKMQKEYAIARIILHVIFVLSAGFVSFRILFPVIPLDFLMSTPNASKNTLVSPRIEQDGQFPEKRLVPAGKNLIFNANPIGQFSKASITFTLDKNEKSLEQSIVTINKSYQAFLYPLGEPIGFKDGTLLTTPNGAYYIISDGLLRKFSDTDTILQLGYPKSSFITVSLEDLKYNKIGDDISGAKAYPNDTIFIVDEIFYQLKNQELSPFVSVRAFSTQFNQSGAIAKKSDFLSTYPISETYSGFSDGALVSSADSVFIISDEKSYPVENADTFLAMGFDFSNVIAVSQDEINAQVKQKQFTHNDPHPNGIVFLDQKSNKYFIIENGLKRPIATEEIAKTYTEKQKPILADSEKAELKTTCTLKKNTFYSDKYSCSISLQDLELAIGNDYQVSTNFPSDIKVKSINTTFSTPLKVSSLKNSLSKIKARIQTR